MTAPEPAAIDEIAALVCGRIGFPVTPERRNDVRSAVGRLTQQCDLSGGLVSAVAGDPALLARLIDAVTVGETYFWREPEQLVMLRDDVLPAMMSRRARPLRVWSAGCSTGEELYSLAILLEQAGLAAGAHLFGSDVSRRALETAARGVYGDWSLRNVSADFVARYLRPCDRRFAVADRLRSRVQLGWVNLASDEYPPAARNIDVLLCRNVLMYFDRDTIAAVARRLYDALADGGWLWTAPTDPLLDPFAPFETVLTSAGVGYRRPSGDARAAHAISSPAPACPTTTPTARQERRVPVPGGAVPRAPQPATRTIDAATWAERVRARANRDGTAAALPVVAEALTHHPLAAELHFLRAVLLMDVAHAEDAERSIRRAIFLDRSLAMAHFVRGELLRRRGDLSGANRAFRTTRELCATLPPDDLVALGDGQSAAHLGEAAAIQMSLIRDAGGAGGELS